MIGKIDSIKEKAEKEILKLNKNKKIKIKDSRPSRTFYHTRAKEINEEEDKDEYENDISNYNDDNDIDIIVLTSNPLIDKKPKKKEVKILSIMNDFNSITYAIYKVVLHCNKQIKASFLLFNRK